MTRYVVSHVPPQTPPPVSVGVLVGVGVGVGVPTTLMTTVYPPKIAPLLARSRHLPAKPPTAPGATRLTEISLVSPGPAAGMLAAAGPPIWLPSANTIWYPAS